MFEKRMMLLCRYMTRLEKNVYVEQNAQAHILLVRLNVGEENASHASANFVYYDKENVKENL